MEGFIALLSVFFGMFGLLAVIVGWPLLSGWMIRQYLVAPLVLRRLPPGEPLRFTLSDLLALAALVQAPMGLTALLRYASPGIPYPPLLAIGLLFAGIAWLVGQRALAASEVESGVVRLALLAVVIPLGAIAAVLLPLTTVAMVSAIVVCLVEPSGSGPALAVMLALNLAAGLTLLAMGAITRSAALAAHRRTATQ